jgi:hypothetical protein
LQARRAHPEDGSAGPQEIRRKAFEALRELLARIADRRVLILHIDDLQWGDLDTASLIRVLLRPPDAPRMLLVLAFRSEERSRSPCLAALDGGALVDPLHLHVGPLPGGEAEELLQSLLATKAARVDLSAIAREAAGNPFLLQELAWFIAQKSENWDGAGPLDVQAALHARFDRLPRPALRLLETISVAGHPVPELVAWRAAGVSGEPSEGSGLLSAQHLVRSSVADGERQLEPFHDRIRETVVAGLSPERARECHRTLAEGLERAGASDPEVLAWHHQVAGDPVRALEFLVPAAAKAQQVLAFDRAARLLERALSLIDGDWHRRLELLGSLGQALANAGRSVEAAKVFLTAAAESPHEKVPFQRKAAEQLMFAGRVNEALALIRPELRAAGIHLSTGPRRALLSLLVDRLWIRIRGLSPGGPRIVAPERLALLEHVQRLATTTTLQDPLIGAALGTRFALEALQTGDPRLVALGTFQLAGHAITAPFSVRTSALMNLACERMTGVGDPRLLTLIGLLKGLRRYAGTDWREAVRILEALDPMLRERAPDLLWELWTSRWEMIRSLLYLGRWKEGRTRLLTAFAHARECGHLYVMASLVANVGMTAWLSQDDVAGARRNLRETSTLWTYPGIQQFWFLAAEVLVDLYEADGRTARERMRGGAADIRRALLAPYPSNCLVAYYLGGCAALASGVQVGPASRVRPALLREAESMARKLERVEGPSCRPLSVLLHAGVAAQRGQAAEASRLLVDAAMALDSVGMRAHADAARSQLARMQGKALPEFLPEEEVVNPEACIRMLAPGFH